MATGNPTLLSGMVAGADLSSSQYFLVKFSATRELVLGTANVVHGVLQNNPLEGAGAAIAAPGTVAKCKAGGTVSAGNLLTSDGDGKAIAVTPNEAGETNTLVVAMAIEDGVDDDVISVIVVGPSNVVTT
jgi:hypothetical protein